MVLPYGGEVRTRENLPRSAVGTPCGSCVASPLTMSALPVPPWRRARAMLARARATHLGSISIPNALRPAWIASTSVVPIPASGSNTQSLGWVYSAIRVAARSGAMPAGWAPEPATNRPRRCAPRLRCPTSSTDGRSSGSASVGSSEPVPVGWLVPVMWVSRRSAMAAYPDDEHVQVDVDLQVLGGS